MADDEQHVGLESEDVMDQHAINNPSGTDDAEGEVNEDILQQALAEASADNSFYPDNMNTNPNTQETENVNTEMYTNESGGVENGQTQLIVQSSDQAADAPLGSRANPIRIIQQGNQYTSMQQLSSEQITQIMQVLQQQQIARSSAQAGGSTVVYNSDNNTRVVYRIIYPNELHKTTTATSNGRSATPNGSLETLTATRKTYRKRKREDGWDEVSDSEWVAADSESEDSRLLGTELSKEEKEERKKHRPRTRSGRVSKPPKYMVKDYKHIHPLDWDEDYDDSDGGYSDFKQSDKEDDGDSKDSVDTSVYSDLHKKTWKCMTCYKSYIGPGGLGRHYRLNPDHGSLDEHAAAQAAAAAAADAAAAAAGMMGQETLDGDMSQDSLSKEAPPGGVAGGVPASLSAAVAAAVGDIRQQPSFMPQQQSAFAAHPQLAMPRSYSLPPAAKKIKTPGYVPTGRPRGRPPSNPAELAVRRRLRLRDLVKQCEIEDLVEVVLPLVTPSVSCWEFLLMRCEESSRSAAAAAGQSASRRVANVVDVLREFDELRRMVARAAADCLRVPAQSNATGPTEVTASHKINIDNEALASALGLSVGWYDATDLRVRSSLTTLQQASGIASGSHQLARFGEDGRRSQATEKDAAQGFPSASSSRAVSSTVSIGGALTKSQMTSHSIPRSSTPVAATTQSKTGQLLHGGGVSMLSHASDVASAAVLQHHTLLQHGVNAHSLMPSAAVLQSAAQLSSQQHQTSGHHVTHAMLMHDEQQEEQDSGQLHAEHDQQESDTMPLTNGLMGEGDEEDGGEIDCSGGGENSGGESLLSTVDGQVITLTGGQLVTADGSIVQLPEGASVIQTAEGIVIYHSGADGTVQLGGGGDGESIALEAMQALLAVDSEGNPHIQYVDQGHAQ